MFNLLRAIRERIEKLMLASMLQIVLTNIDHIDLINFIGQADPQPLALSNYKNQLEDLSLQLDMFIPLDAPGNNDADIMEAIDHIDAAVEHLEISIADNRDRARFLSDLVETTTAKKGDQDNGTQESNTEKTP